MLLTQCFRAGLRLRKSLNQNGVARKSAAIAVKLWISISGFESLGGSQILQHLGARARLVARACALQQIYLRAANCSRTPAEKRSVLPLRPPAS